MELVIGDGKGNCICSVPLSVPKRGMLKELGIKRMVLEETHEVDPTLSMLRNSRGQEFIAKILVGKLGKTRKLLDVVQEMRTAFKNLKFEFNTLLSTRPSQDFHGVFYVSLEDPGETMRDGGYIKMTYSIDGDFVKPLAKRIRIGDSRVMKLLDENEKLLGTIELLDIDADLFDSLGPRGLELDVDASYTTRNELATIESRGFTTLILSKVSLIESSRDFQDVVAMSIVNVESRVAVFFRLSDIEITTPSPIPIKINMTFVEVSKVNIKRGTQEREHPPLGDGDGDGKNGDFIPVPELPESFHDIPELDDLPPPSPALHSMFL